MSKAEEIALYIEKSAHRRGIPPMSPPEWVYKAFIHAGCPVEWVFTYVWTETPSGPDRRLESVVWVDTRTKTRHATYDVQSGRGEVFWNSERAYFQSVAMHTWLMEEWDELSSALRANPSLCVDVTDDWADEVGV